MTENKIFIPSLFVIKIMYLYNKFLLSFVNMLNLTANKNIRKELKRNFIKNSMNIIFVFTINSRCIFSAINQFSTINYFLSGHVTSKRQYGSFVAKLQHSKLIRWYFVSATLLTYLIIQRSQIINIWTNWSINRKSYKLI